MFIPWTFENKEMAILVKGRIPVLSEGNFKAIVCEISFHLPFYAIAQALPYDAFE
jgi:hypothetical protein